VGLSANVEANEFLHAYGPLIERRSITIGCSFSQEHCQWLGASPLDVLRLAVESYGIRDVRLGMRWSNLAPDGAAIADYYRESLDYCLYGGKLRRVFLDIGPIKTFRWPEVHVPSAVFERFAVAPPIGAEIGASDSLAVESYRHVRRVLEYLATLTKGADAQLRIGFAFNEPFHRFGPHEWTMSEDYLWELVRVISGYFPGAEFLVNSSEGRQLDRIADFFETLVAEDGSFVGRLTSGYDLYPFVPDSRAWGAIRALRAGMPLAGRQRWRAASQSIARAHAIGYSIEVTEAQAEPWPPVPLVGNSLSHFVEVLRQSIDHVLDPTQPSSVIRMWGIEHQVARVTSAIDADENRAILELTREINAIGSGH
jgi:hypothetical protein